VVLAGYAGRLVRTMAGKVLRGTSARGGVDGLDDLGAV
jgi:hypothetical protein